MNALKSCMAAIAPPALVAGALAFGPVQASAPEITGDDTATTDVTIAAGPGWGQKTQVVDMTQGTQGGPQGAAGALATTGDAAPLAPIAAAAAAAAGLAALAAKKKMECEGKEAADGGEA